MALIDMQKPKKNSPPTTLSAGINDSVTTIGVADTSVFYDADSALITSGIVIGFDDATETNAEEITITGASTTSGAGNLTGVTRGVNADGTIGAAKAWLSGDSIAVMLTSTGIEAIEDNITTLSAQPWTDILSSITATPASTSTITTTSDLTGSIKIGYPLRYTISSVVYYGIVTAITSSLITVAGAPLSGTVTAISYGDPARVQQQTIVVNGYYADASNTTLIEDDLFIKGGLLWLLSGAYIVQASYIAAAVDTGATAEKINITIGGSDLLSADTSVSTTLTKSIVNISTANYSIATGDAIEIDVTKGTNGDGHDLVVNLVAVFP